MKKAKVGGTTCMDTTPMETEESKIIAVSEEQELC